MQAMTILTTAFVLTAASALALDKNAAPPANHVPQTIQLDPVKAAAYIPKVAGTASWDWFLSAELVDLNAKPAAKKKPVANDAATVTRVMRGQEEASPIPRLEVIFGNEIKQLDGKEIKLAGFMMPLDMKEQQTHFLLSAYPPSCPYCLPGGPNATIEVHCKKPVTFTYDPVVVRGKLQLLRSDASGFFYRMTDVVPAR